MQAIDTRILDAANSRISQVPCAFVDVYADIAARVAIDSTSQWTGTNDPMKGSDTNVSFDRVVGAVTLSEGAVKTSAYGGASILAGIASMSAYVTAHWHTEGGFWNRHSVHDYFSKVITSQISEMSFPFTAQATSIMESVLIRASYSGYTTRACYVRVIDSNGNQVGSEGHFTPALATASYTISGLSASLYKGRDYALKVGYPPFSTGELPNPYYVPRTNYSFSLVLDAYAVADPIWEIPVASSKGFSIGGNEGYQASGDITRQLDMGVVPANEGTLSFVDVVPSGTTQVVTLWYTNSDVYALETSMTNWTLLGVRESGDGVPAQKYWRAVIDMTANATNDEAPAMARLEITYKEDPITIGTHPSFSDFSKSGFFVPAALPWTSATITDLRLTGTKALDKISTIAAQMSPGVASSMIGRMTISLAPEAIVDDLASKQLRGKLAVVRVGFVIDGTPVASELYKGVVEEIAWNGKNYTLTIQDDMDIVDVKLPRTKAGDAWATPVLYTAGTDTVVFGTESYDCAITHTSGVFATDLAAGKWVSAGTVWADIVYTDITSPDAPTDWHLADVCEDILLNHVNVPTQRVDLESLALVRAAYPNMRGSRTITKPIGAIELLTELAWLLNSQWVMRQGKLALVEEPTVSAIEAIGDADIKNRINYKRGFGKLKNEVLILSGYSGDGEGDEQFLDSWAYADATSIADYEMVGLEVFKDKWSVASTELVTRATTYVNKWKDGRRTITGLKATMRLLPLEVGDVASFNSILLPPFDQTKKDYIVIARDVDWFSQNLTLSLLEV